MLLICAQSAEPGASCFGHGVCPAQPKNQASSRCCGAARRRVGQHRLDGRFRLARSAWEQDDRRDDLGSDEQVIAVAADEDQSLRTSMAKDLFVGCSDR